jgi:hypothetical protein
MKRAMFKASLVFATLSACKPSVGPPISSINGPAILAIKGEPAEVDPKTATSTVRYQALAVDLGGRVPAATADITSPMFWSICDQPKPPTENNSVSAICLDQDYLPGTVGDSLTTYTAPVPLDSCQLFGPETPPAAAGQPAIRPRDPDVTGGYYLPVRASLLVPEDLRRAGMATEDTLVAFQLQRIYCGLANATGGDIFEYGKNYKLNNNPVLNPLTLRLAVSDPVPLAPVSAGGVPVEIPAGQTVSLVASWPVESVENYPAWDVLQHALLYHNEGMRISWYATGGSFEHDVTGRSETESDTFTENTWKADEPGLVHFWVVLHDSRGGTDFAGYDIVVTP